MKVLQIAFDSMNIGGVQKVIMDIAENIPDCQFDVVVIAKNEGYYEEQFKTLGGRVFRILSYEGNNPARKFFDLFNKKLRLFTGIYKIIKKYGPYDAIHSHNQFRSGFANAAAFFAGVKIRIAHIHNNQPPSNYNILKKTLYFFYKVLVLIFSNVKLACSANAARFLFLNPNHAEVVLNGIDTEKFDISKYKHMKTKQISYIHVGRYNFQKNQLFLLEVFAKIIKLEPDSKLTLVGFGNDEEKIINRIRKPDLKGRVTMCPPDSDIPKLLSESDFMIFPSNYEGLGIAVLEAQVMGVKCFVSEAIPIEADLGLLTYLSLKSSPAEWADRIIESKRLHDFSIRPAISPAQKSRIDVKMIAGHYTEIYEGKTLRN